MAAPGTYETSTADMVAVHRALLGAFDEATKLVGSVGADTERFDDVVNFYSVVLDFLHAHHGGEDELLYPKLEERCPEHRALLEAIDSQHQALNGPMAAAQAALAAWSVDSPESALALVDALAAVDLPLRAHLREEEATVLPIAAKWVSPEEWDELRAHGMGATPPDKLWLIMGLIFEQLPEPAREAMYANMPPEVRTVAEEQWLPMFASFMGTLRS